MGHLGLVEIIMILVVPLILVLILVLPAWKVISKTGNSGALSLLLMIPLVNVVILFYLAYSKWPIEKELDGYRISKS
jgi:steroid 5-alpha reductase family enzyme